MSKRNSWAQMLDRETEKPVLEALYLQESVATDQLRRAPEVMGRITRAFNRITSRDFGSSDLLRYMINRRKEPDWPKLGNRALKFECLRDYLSSQQLAVLKQIYIDMNLPSDEILYHQIRMAEVARRFEGLTGRRESGAVLIGVIMAHRKRGMWPCIREEEGFGDIDQLAG